MVYRRMFILIGCLLFFTSCGVETSVNDESYAELIAENKVLSDRIADLEQEVQRLSTSVIEFENLVNTIDDNNEAFKRDIDSLNSMIGQKVEDSILKTINLSHSFVQAYISGDFEVMRTWCSKSIEISDGKISVIRDENVIEYDILDDLVGFNLNSYGTEDDKVFYQYVLYDENGTDITGRLLINLIYVNDGGVWELMDIEYDI